MIFLYKKKKNINLKIQSMKTSLFVLFLTFPILICTASKNYTYRIRCIGNNSFINEDGKCECKSEFPFGEPNSTEGCWNCDPMCDFNSICYKSNKCKCLPGFYKFGSHNDSCRLPIPELLKINPETGPTSGGSKIFLEIKSPPKHKVVKAFCRFGPIFVPAKFSNDTLFICISPNNRRGKVPLSISYDSVRWSEKQFFFRYYNEGYSAYHCILLIILILIISLLAVIIFWYFRSQKEFLTQSEEMLPLNQWHINQGLESITQEKGFLDFVKNIAIY